MFIKIEGSAQLYSTLGDQAARQSINQILQKIQDMVNLLEGKVIKIIDDGMMCRFSTVDDAVKASTLIQASSGSAAPNGDSGFRLRIGAQQGDVLEEDNDVFGDTVNVAARFQQVARPGQTIISADMALALPTDLQNRVRQVDLTRLKGKQEEVALYEVLWELTEEVTQQVPAILAPGKIDSQLTLSFNGQQFVMKQRQRTILIGRGPSCQFVVDTRLASREHAVIESRRGKYVIKDQGSNGTYVKSATGQPVFLRREELILPDEGFISLGEAFAKCHEADLIHFKCG